MFKLCIFANQNTFWRALIGLPLLFFPILATSRLLSSAYFPAATFCLCEPSVSSPSQTAGEGDTDCRLPVRYILTSHLPNLSQRTILSLPAGGGATETPARGWVQQNRCSGLGSLQPVQKDPADLLCSLCSSSSWDSSFSPTADYLTDVCSLRLLRSVSISLAAGCKGQPFTEVLLN